MRAWKVNLVDLKKDRYIFEIFFENKLSLEKILDPPLLKGVLNLINKGVDKGVLKALNNLVLFRLINY